MANSTVYYTKSGIGKTKNFGTINVDNNYCNL